MNFFFVTRFLGLFLSNFKKIHISGQKYVSLNILWITFMILGLKHNIIAGGQFDPPRAHKVIPQRR